ncbi:hypothetical protein ACFFU1_05190 [Algibacter miyuki]|uniref:Selenophosphate synthetase n=1 Tax=Algibacter miyuki TaxID=1306933 RepID=A0ABV5GXI7_9FLAO|nr:hypothetical protein [Algibacter miyuki]MDN3666019.1 hypothetical protein [Algibacter miyuki]
MKNFIYITLIALLITACKDNTKSIPEEKPLTIAEKIAHAHGFENWKNVNEIDFTFNVDTDSTHFERRWVWKPKTNHVIAISATDTISYNRSAVDSISMKADRGFINDKFWLLIPFQLVWDSGTTISEPVITEAPISKTALNKITLTYSNEGGYTPSDAYDIFYDDDYRIQEWIFRKGNQEKPSMMTTFEDYQDFNGITLALSHKKPEGSWNLNFTNIKISK